MAISNMNSESGAQILRPNITGSSGGGVSAGGVTITEVETLPALPTKGVQFVFWTSTGDGTGDDQAYMGHQYGTLWIPQEFTTELDCTPGT